MELELNGDMKKWASGRGFAFSQTAVTFHGNSITADNIRSLMPVSNLEATPSTKLYELWFEQHHLPIISL